MAETFRQFIYAKKVNFAYFDLIHRRPRRRLYGGLDDDGNRVEPWITIEPRIDAHNVAEDHLSNAGFLFQLTNNAIPQILTPLERTTRQRPFTRIATPNQQPPPVSGVCRSGDTRYRPTQQMPSDFLYDFEVPRDRRHTATLRHS